MKMIRAAALLLALLTAAVCAVSCARPSDGTLELIEDKSSYTDYQVANDAVTIYCEITVKNTCDRERIFALNADFPDDEGVLLKEHLLSGVDADTGREVFRIAAGEEKTYTVLFIGNYGGTNQKHDRALPQISILPADRSR